MPSMEEKVGALQEDVVQVKLQVEQLHTALVGLNGQDGFIERCDEGFEAADRAAAETRKLAEGNRRSIARMKGIGTGALVVLGAAWGLVEWFTKSG